VLSRIALAHARRYSGFTMFDTLFTIGQAASTLLLLYGAFLVLVPARQAPAMNSKLEDKLLLLEHIHNDA
jgi:hypothetical protein